MLSMSAFSRANSLYDLSGYIAGLPAIMEHLYWNLVLKLLILNRYNNRLYISSYQGGTMRCTGFLLIFLTINLIYGGQTNMPVTFMPIPQKVTYTTGDFKLDSSFTITIQGSATGRLCAYATRVLRRLDGRTGLFFSQDFITPDKLPGSASLILRINREGRVVLGEDESYRLVVAPERMVLTAETDIGAMRGLETFLQLLQVEADTYIIRGVDIEDAPRYPWRGLLIDVCRHFMPVEVIKRNLDGMAAVKLNVLHWHLSEDQGFRVQCNSFPKLHQMGSDGFYYTQEQIREVLAYAQDRGIRVMPEFDIPGHATSWLTAYPELASLPGPYQIERKFGIFDPTFNPTIELTYEFFDIFFKEMTTLFTDEYLHIGGDENSGNQWNANPEIQAFMKKNNIKDNHALQSYFNNRILTMLTGYGKKMVGWDEILHPGMPKNIVIQSWRGRESMVQAAREGYQTILSNGYYIDLIHPTDKHYVNDPLPEGIELNEAEKKLVLGGEATMWAEFVTPETIDSRIWPRTAAIAERFWSSGEIRDVEDMYNRLEEVHFRLEELGLLHEKNYFMLLRRLTNNQDIEPLRTLVDVLEPVKRYNRGAQRAYTSYSPLTRVVDAARPDAKAAREFRNQVKRYLAGEKRFAAILEEKFKLWRKNHTNLKPIIEKSPVLHEIERMSADLSQTADIGLTALRFLLNNNQPDADWIKQQMAYLEKAKAPRGQTELMILPAIEQLVKRCAPSN
jgi:hexosaminidase